MTARQVGGTSLYTDKTVGTATAAVNSSTDPAGDAFATSAGQTSTGSAAEDLAGVSVTRPDATHLTFTMRTGDANLAADLAPPAAVAAAGGTTAVYLVRWAERYEPTLDEHLHRHDAVQVLQLPRDHRGARLHH